MEHDRKHILTTLKKARGTLEKVIEMTEDDIYCADVAHQINAAMGLLKSANRELMRDHLSCCGSDAFAGKGKLSKDAFIEEILRIWDVATRK